MEAQNNFISLLVFNVSIFSGSDPMNNQYLNAILPWSLNVRKRMQSMYFQSCLLPVTKQYSVKDSKFKSSIKKQIRKPKVLNQQSPLAQFSQKEFIFSINSGIVQIHYRYIIQWRTWNCPTKKRKRNGNKSFTLPSYSFLERTSGAM